MRLVITAEHHFVKAPDGTYWGPDTMTYRFWERYLAVFDHIAVAARVRPVDRPGPAFARVDGPSVSVQALPEYLGPADFLKVRRAFHRAAAAATTPDDAVLLRVGCSPLAAAVEAVLKKRDQPYGVEVITDPYLVFAPSAIQHPLRPVFRRLFVHQLQRQVAAAVAATYVTRTALQQRYPAAATAYSTSYSDVDLPAEAFVAGGRSGVFRSAVPTVVSVGAMAHRAKGFDVLLDAIACCARRGVRINVRIVGDGKLRPELEQQVCRLGLGPHVIFTGQLAGGAAVRAELDNADLFVMASRHEGLPRAMIEAQARALPCIGTRVGGLPELLNETNLVAPDDPDALSAHILAMIGDPVRRAHESAHNLRRARTFSHTELAGRRLRFLEELRDRTLAAAPRAASAVPPVPPYLPSTTRRPGPPLLAQRHGSMHQ